MDGVPEQMLAARLRFQAEACRRLGSPLYAGLLTRAAGDVEAHGPTWEVLRGHERDLGPSALALRLMGAVHRLVLRGDEPTLAEIYYGESECDESRAWTTFRAVLERNTESLRELVELPVQTNEVGRCAALLPGFIRFAAETGLPLRLLEVGASAGLNLRWDRYRYRCQDFAWGSPRSTVEIGFEVRGDERFPASGPIEIASREGCDTAPIDAATHEGRLALLAYVWPDQPDRIKRLRAALDLAAELPVSIERKGAAAWVERKLAQRSAGQATVIFHSIVTQYLPDEERAAFEGHVREAGERSAEDSPLAWLRMEPAGDLAEVRIRTWPGGGDRRIVRSGYHGSPIELLG